MPTLPSMQDLLVLVARHKQTIKDAQADLVEVEADLVAAMKKQGKKSVSDGDLKGTLVEPTRITIDEDALKKALSAAQWKKVTKTVLDKEKLEASIVTGDVDANVVAAASTETDTKPYVKVSGKLPVKPQPAARRVRPKPKKATT